MATNAAGIDETYGTNFDDDERWVLQKDEILDFDKLLVKYGVVENKNKDNCNKERKNNKKNIDIDRILEREEKNVK